MEFPSPPSSSSSPSSSPRLSGLSTSTSTSLSSAFSGSELSSLPSPSLSPAPRDTVSEYGAKTNAFFSSPFSPPPSPLPPPALTPRKPKAANTAPASVIPLVAPPPATPAPSPRDGATKKRDYLWLDLNRSNVEDLSRNPTPVLVQRSDDDDSTPRIPSVTPQMHRHEELAVGSVIHAKIPPRSRTVSADNTGYLTSSSASSSPLTQSPASQVSGLPETTPAPTLSFSGLPPEFSDIGIPLLTVESPKPPETTLRLLEPLGTGAFSSVWLAEDLSDDPLVLQNRRSIRNLRREGSLPPSRTNSLRRVRVPGVRPVGASKEMMLLEPERSATLSVQSPSSSAYATRLVALKITARSMYWSCSDRDQEVQRNRTRVSFVREVEVLRHISHPNITKLLTYLTTPSYHVLVLPYLPGGDLLGLVNSDEAHNVLGESLLRRMWGELCKAVGWMHGVGLVHRDVKLENILLTAPFPFAKPPSGPLIKLTDFGLSRFIDVESPMLSTRCGSEAYAAPELVISGRKYDARETDAWACGVVLYGLCARRLPFGEGAASPGPGDRIGREGGAREGAAARRHWLMTIARGEWSWPEIPAPAAESTPASNGVEVHHSHSGDSERTVTPDKHGDKEEEKTEELAGPRLVECKGARRVVARLLVRDPARRAKISELWDDPWVRSASTGGSSIPSGSRITDVETQSPVSAEFDLDKDKAEYKDEYWELDGEVEGFDDEDLEEEDDDVNDNGLLLDQDGIDNIARQEVQ